MVSIKDSRHLLHIVELTESARLRALWPVAIVKLTRALGLEDAGTGQVRRGEHMWGVYL